MTIYAIRHVTTYRYAAPVAFGEHRFLLRSRDGFDQRTVAAKLEIRPRPSHLSWTEDSSGNLLGIARFDRWAQELVFDSAIEVHQTVGDPRRLEILPYARTCPFSYGAEEFPDLARFVERHHPDAEHAVDSWVRGILDAVPGRDTMASLARLNAAIHRDFAYLRREEQGIQRPDFTLRIRRGSCRDFAVLMMDALRAVGFATRFVSGYLYVRPAASARSVARGSMHAWLQVYLPGAGWLDCDPASGTIGNEGLIRTAVARGPDQAVPLHGSFIGFPSAALGMEVGVSVKKIPGAGRATETLDRRAG